MFGVVIIMGMVWVVRFGWDGLGGQGGWSGRVE